MCDSCRAAIAEARAAGQALIIEGVGGVMVPLNRRPTVLDWIDVLAIPAVLVVGSYLGALSRALSAASVLAERGIGLAVIVVSESAQSVGIEATVETLGDFLPGAKILGVPRIETAAEPWRRAPGAGTGEICLDG